VYPTALYPFVGRLHRLHKDKSVVRVYDYVDSCVPVLNRMYDRRLNYIVLELFVGRE